MKCVEDEKNFKGNSNVKANQWFQLKNYDIQLLLLSALGFNSGVLSLSYTIGSCE